MDAEEERKIFEHFGKDKKAFEQDVGIIREWLKSQPHLPEVACDQLIGSFLLNNKFSIERTKEKLDMFYTIRPLVPEVFFNVNPRTPAMKEIARKIYYVPLPRLTKDLKRVFLLKIRDPEVEITSDDIYKFVAHCLHINEYVFVNGKIAVSSIVVSDHSNSQMKHMLHMTPMHLKKSTAVLEKVYSNRVEAFHNLSFPAFANAMFALFKSMMKPKMARRFVLHKDVESLYGVIPKEILPKDYGGEEKTLDELNEEYLQKLEEMGDYFDKMENLKVDEGLRPKALVNCTEMGFHGNFKSLDVD